MNQSYLKKLSIILLMLSSGTSHILLPANGKKARKAHAKKPKVAARVQQQVLPSGQVPSGMQLIKRTLVLCDKQLVLDLIARAGLTKAITAPMSDEEISKIIMVLEGKDLIAIFDTYLTGFISNPEPFMWDIVRMETFIQIAQQRLNEKDMLIVDFEKNKGFYNQRFGIDSFPTFKRTLRALIDESKELHNEIKNPQKLGAMAILTTLKAYLQRLQTRMPKKLADIIDQQLNGASSLTSQLQLVSQVRQRLNRK